MGREHPVPQLRRATRTRRHALPRMPSVDWRVRALLPRMSVANLHRRPTNHLRETTPMTDFFAQSGAAWLAAVARRTSRRAFDGQPADTVVLDTLDTACSGFRPFPDARVVLVRAPRQTSSRGSSAATARSRMHRTSCCSSATKARTPATNTRATPGRRWCSRRRCSGWTRAGWAGSSTPHVPGSSSTSRR